MQSCSRPSANVRKRTVQESSMPYSSYRPKAATPKLNTRESNAELTPSCVQQGSHRFSSLRTQNWSPKTNQKKKKEPKNKREKKDQQLEQEFMENRNVVSTYMKKKDYNRAAAGRYKETRRRRRRNLKPTRDGYGSRLLLQHTSATTCALCTELSVTELYTRPSSWCGVSQSAHGSLCLPWKEALGTFCCFSLLPKGKAAL